MKLLLLLVALALTGCTAMKLNGQSPAFPHDVVDKRLGDHPFLMNLTHGFIDGVSLNAGNEST